MSKNNGVVWGCRPEMRDGFGRFFASARLVWVARLPPGAAQRISRSRRASVEIRGNTPGQIVDGALAVFGEKGYTVAQPGLTRLVCEKEGSTMRNLAYGNWIQDTPIWIRVKVSIVAAGEATCRLECHALMVRGKGEPVEEEISISLSGPGLTRNCSMKWRNG